MLQYLPSTWTHPFVKGTLHLWRPPRQTAESNSKSNLDQRPGRVDREMAPFWYHPPDMPMETMTTKIDKSKMEKIHGPSGCYSQGQFFFGTAIQWITTGDLSSSAPVDDVIRSLTEPGLVQENHIFQGWLNQNSFRWFHSFFCAVDFPSQSGCLTYPFQFLHPRPRLRQSECCASGHRLLTNGLANEDGSVMVN